MTILFKNNSQNDLLLLFNIIILHIYKIVANNIFKIFPYKVIAHINGLIRMFE